MSIHWAQVGRAARLFAFAFLAQLAAAGTDHLDRAVLVSAGLAALEVVYRQFWPADQGGRGPDNSSDAVQ